MDGLTISNTNRIIGELGSATSSGALEKKSSAFDFGGDQDKSFANTLKEAIGSVDKLQKTADVQIQKLATGENKNIPDVLIAVEKADIALKLMVQVRNKVIDAYSEVMKMQV